MSERVERWGRGLASLALLVGLVVGVPAALLVLGGDPVPQRWDPAGLLQLLLRPDDGTVLARLLALVGWLAWAVFALSLLVELVNLVPRRTGVLVLPGLGGVQRWAAGLMLAVVALGGAAQLSAGPTAPTSSVSRPVTPPDGAASSSPAKAGGTVARAVAEPAPTQLRRPSATSSARGPETPAPLAAGAPGPAGSVPASRGERETVHVVVVGDDLWSLAEHYYGRGQEWRRIATANPDRLTGGPDRLRVGWRLVIPEGARRSSPSRSASTVEEQVRVRVGDTLTSVAERELGDGGRWPELYRANRDQLGDPDELPAGLLLRLPPHPGARPGSTGEDAGRRSTDAARAASQGPERQRDPEQGSGRQQESGHQQESGRQQDPGDRDAPSASASPGGATPSPTRELPAEAGASRSDAPAPAAPASAGTAAAATPDAAPSASDPTATEPAASQPSGTRPADASSDAEQDGAGVLLPGLAGVGGLLAAALVGGLAGRRRWQLQRRPVGRRIAHPPSSTRPVEVELGRRARPIGLRTLDRASRALAAAAVDAGVAVPALRTASVSDEWLVLELVGATPPAPRCFVDTGGSWCLAADAVDGLRAVRGLSDASRPWPLLVTLGTDDLGAERVVDLESFGSLAVAGDEDLTTAVLAAMALELACSPWTDDLRLTLVGDDRLAPALAQHNVSTTDDVEALVDRLERTGRARALHAGGRTARDLRQDPDLGEAWTPEVVLVDASLTPVQAQRLVRLASAPPGAGLTVVLRGPADGAAATLRLAGDGSAVLEPGGVRLVPQTLPVAGLAPVVDLVATTGSGQTQPAPWWSSADPPDDPPDNVTYLGRRRRPDEGDEQERRAEVQARMTELADGTVRHPLLQLIGPVELLGAAGVAPPRAAKQCLEYCAWLLENPGTSAQAMASGLLVAEGTRRSNMSRLRSWLGSAADGQSYLPDAYSGRIRLDPMVSSDWHQLQLLVGDGVDRAPSSVLELGLRLVRGAPLADAAPVQWHWAEELRTDIVSCVRDIGVELARRALADRDLDLARWSAARALVAAPGDELLLGARIRTEHLAGNAAETERLSLQLAQQARALGVDLHPATVDLIQEVMEGRVRARLA